MASLNKRRQMLSGDLSASVTQTDWAAVSVTESRDWIRSQALPNGKNDRAERRTTMADASPDLLLSSAPTSSGVESEKPPWI